MHDPFAPLSMDSYSSFGSNTLFAPAPHSFFDTPSFIVEAPPEMNKQAVYPSTSPSVATTRSLEHPPSTVSTASGPSLTSASSSAVGSPYSKATHGVPYQENWVDMSNGLPLNCDNLPRDFVSSGMDPEMVFAQGKLPDTFVGEFDNISSSVEPEKMATFSSSISPTVDSFHSSPLSLNRSPEDLEPDVTIDSILQGDYTTTTPSPLATTPAMSYRSASFSSTPHRGEKSPQSFRSPVTPNSTISTKHAMRSPAKPHRHRSFTYPAPAPGVKRRSNSSRQNKQYPGQSSFSLELPDHNRDGSFQNSFFRQSSGNFVLPLESSCWFFLADTPCRLLL